jgi:hypothetical protein
MQMTARETVGFNVAYLAREITRVQKQAPGPFTQGLREHLLQLQAALIDLGVVTEWEVQRAAASLKKIAQHERKHA